MQPVPPVRIKGYFSLLPLLTEFKSIVVDCANVLFQLTVQMKTERHPQKKHQ